MFRVIYLLAVVACAALVVVAVKYWNDVEALLHPDPVVVVGILRSGGRAVAGATVELHLRGTTGREAVTNARGEFHLSFRRPGDYSVWIGMSRLLPSVIQEVTLKAGKNEVNFDVPGTRVDVKMHLPRRVSAGSGIQLALSGPASLTSQNLGVISTDMQEAAAAYVGLGYGEYTLTAYSNDDKSVSRVPAHFRLGPQEATAIAELSMTTRQLHVMVTDSDGRPVDGATVSSFGQKAPQLGPGEFDASFVPFGQMTMVKAPGLLPVCTHAADGGSQHVVLPKKSEGVAQLRLRGGPRKPVGFLVGLPGTDCAVPLALLDLKWQAPSTGTYVTVSIEGLPEGAYEYRPQEAIPGRRVAVPGPVVEYEIPAYCRFCGG
jgi:hypothetical protein